MKKFKLTILSLILIANILYAVPTAYSQDIDIEIQEPEISLCQDDWLAFVSSVISYDGFTEYWKDIFVRYNKNICYYMDINNILSQLENARSQIRNAYYSCNNASAVTLSERYFELEVELFYLRNFIDIPESEVTKIPDAKVFQKVRDEFTINRNFYTEEEIKEIFNKLKEKYKNKVSVYSECNDPGLKQLITKWDSLVTNFKAMGITGEAIREKWENSLNTPSKRTGPQIKGVLDIRLNNLPPKKSANEILNELQKEETGGLEPTLDEFQSALIKYEEDYSNKEQQATLTAKYEALYKKGGDTTGNDFVDKIKELNKIITDTFQPLETLKTCSTKIAERQCK